MDFLFHCRNCFISLAPYHLRMQSFQPKDSLSYVDSEINGRFFFDMIKEKPKIKSNCFYHRTNWNFYGSKFTVLTMSVFNRISLPAVCNKIRKILVAVAVCRLDTMWTGVCCFGCNKYSKNVMRTKYLTHWISQKLCLLFQLSAVDWNSNIKSTFLVQLKQVQSVKIKSKLNIKTNFHRTFVIPCHTVRYAVAAIEKSRIWQVGAKLFVISFVENSCSYFICSHETQRGVAQTSIIYKTIATKETTTNWWIHMKYRSQYISYIHINTDKHFSTFPSIPKSIVFEFNKFKRQQAGKQPFDTSIFFCL